jgi:hypothetical protein
LGEPYSLQMSREFDWPRVVDKLLASDGLLSRHSDSLITVGSPLYLADSLAAYRNNVERQRGPLLDNFGDLIQDFADTLQSFVGQRVVFGADLACPGFHIFSATRERPYLGGIWHVDEFRFPILPVPVSMYSATLLIGDETGTYTLETQVSDQVQSHRHRVGWITVINSLDSHRVGPFSSEDGSRVRVTLQGHIWLFKDRGVLFW